MKYYKKLIGKKCYLSPISLQDAEKYCEWLNDLEVTKYTLLFRQQLSLQSERNILEQLQETGNYIFSIVDLQNDELIGNCSLFDVNHRNRKAMFGILIGNKKYWNRGFGTEATKLILDFGFNILNLHNIMLEVFDFNKRAIKAYQKAGFKIIGKRREAMILAGKKYDEILMDAIASEFDSIFIKENLEF